MSALVSNSDEDLADWQAGQQSVFLEMVCAEVRAFCGWHIAPSLEVVGKVCYFGDRGLVTLGSTYVTDISSVVVEGNTLTAGCDYSWQEPKGWLRLHPSSWAFPAPHREPKAIVSFTHGYVETPQDVKAVIFEVLATAMELPASNATEVVTTQYRFNLKPNVGITLSDDQKDRLGRYRLRSFGGRVRP
jgi:hypothetical protein